MCLPVLAAAPAAAGEALDPMLSVAPIVKSVAIVGTHVPVNLATQAGRTYDAGAVGKDVHELWSRGRFEDIRVETSHETDGAAVVFHVREAPDLRLHAVRIEPHSFGLNPKFTAGTPVDRLRAHEIALAAQRRLNAEGYLNARVDYDLAPYSRREVDLRLTVRAGESVEVKEVEFFGDAGIDPKELRGALRNVRIRRVLPGIPGVWGGWRLFPSYSPETLDSDLGRLRSLYLSKGYFDASVRLHDATINGKAANLRIDVQSGPLYRVREWTVAGARLAPARVHPADGLLHAGEFCSCLFAARRDAERSGILDFSLKLNVQRVPDGNGGAAPVADLTASVDEGQPYRVGRIEITGNRHFADRTVRRNLLLDEGQWFDERLLHKSIARLNQTAWFEPVAESEIVIHSHPKTGKADVAIHLTERRRRAWAISGPLGPASFAGPLQASISSRLPAWGRDMFELSTYTASVSLLAFAHPLLPFLSVSSKWPLLPVLALQRPYTPGEGWKSGFVFTPQLGWRSFALSYASVQIQHRLVPVLADERGLEPVLPVAVERPQGNVMLLCEPPKPRFAGLRSAAALVVQFLGALPAL